MLTLALPHSYMHAQACIRASNSLTLCSACLDSKGAKNGISDCMLMLSTQIPCQHVPVLQLMDSSSMIDMGNFRKCLHDQSAATVEKWVCLFAKDTERLHIWCVNWKEEKKKPQQPSFLHLLIFKPAALFSCHLSVAVPESHFATVWCTPTHPLWFLTESRSSGPWREAAQVGGSPVWANWPPGNPLVSI